MIRVALVGCGRIARVHAGYLRRIPQVELVGVWDRDPSAATAFGDSFRVPVYTSLQDLLDKAVPQAVHILTPPFSHAELAIEFLRAGVSVLIEKPMAMTCAEVDAILAEKPGNCWVTVDHNRWFDPVVQEAAAMCEGGRLGRLVGVEVFQSAELSLEPDRWSNRLRGGPVHNLVSHPLYLMRRFAGRAKGLHAVARKTQDGRLEEVRVAVDGERSLAVLTLTTGTRPLANGLVLLGSEATVEINLNNMTLVERRPRRLPKVLGKVWPNLHEAAQLVGATIRNTIAFATGKQRYYPGIGVHLQRLYASVAAGGDPPVTAEEGRDVAAWYDEILAQVEGPGSSEGTGGS